MSKQTYRIGELVALPAYMDDLTYTIVDTRVDESTGVTLFRLDDGIWYEERYLIKL